jgi:predicted ATP-binding protein involved in virulence
MQIKQLFVKNLYNLYSYDINFSEKKDNICILTGVNGYGKTTILKIIDSLSKNDLFYFYTFPFEELRIVFTNSDILEISQNYPSMNEDMDFVAKIPELLDFTYKTSDEKIISHFFLSMQDICKAISSPARRFLDFSFVDDNSLTYIKDFISGHMEIYEKLALQQNQGQFLSLLKDIKTVFVPAQRLYYTEEEEASFQYRNRMGYKKTLSSIDKMITEFKEELQKRRLDYLLESQKHDNQFIHKLVSSTTEGYDEKTYNQKADTLQTRLDELYSFNLIDKISTLPYDKNKKNILSVYIDDLSEKLDSYNDLISKLRIFSEIITRKDFSNKKISFSPEQGLIIIASDGNEINANALSSGEQNELIMLYRFIFGISNGSILLIDEPEISLHVSWQLDFLNDIEEILREKNMQVIIATHSPQIINEHWDNCFDFYENNDGQRR